MPPTEHIEAFMRQMIIAQVDSMKNEIPSPAEIAAQTRKMNSLNEKCVKNAEQARALQEYMLVQRNKTLNQFAEIAKSRDVMRRFTRILETDVNTLKTTALKMQELRDNQRKLFDESNKYLAAIDKRINDHLNDAANTMQVLREITSAPADQPGPSGLNNPQ
ncbi:unnamed protein product [Caenorhabditis bovis]|uniref:Uncharacterized protein n=1 Tax=Caenorhabditis bovis TaxID=2654633 RepID=A0A8S1EC66_9PELO|nr:unnamed protein product [Caenorhabditis bovis]